MLVLFLFLLLGTSTINSYRLPGDLIPSSYALDIITSLGEENNFDFEGRVLIEVTCITPTSNVTLHSKNLEISIVRIYRLPAFSDNDDIDDSNSIAVEDIALDDENEFLIILLTENLEIDDNIRIIIDFKGVLEKSLRGFYRSSYQENNITEWIGVTQFEPIAARRAFPCFDEPNMKATFKINVGRHQNYNSISNMPLIETSPIEGKPDWFWDQYENSVKMSTYLVAFIVSDFGYVESDPTDNNVTFKIWARESVLSQVSYASVIGPQILEYYENFFDLKYPLPKMDMVAIPDFNTFGMANWGLITYREATLLFDSSVSSTFYQRTVASAIAHELAHQWFGNLVTMNWWTDLWLKEGFATYLASQAINNLVPNWEVLDKAVVKQMLTVFSIDALTTSHPLSVEIDHLNEITEIFDDISYDKGSLLIRMMSHFLGVETFKKGITSYLKTFQYTNAEQDDLWKSLTEQAHEDDTLPKNLTVKTVMDTWTLQTGYPIITVTRQYDKNEAIIEQTRFFKSKVLAQESEDKCWWIPLSYTDAEDRDFNSTNPKLWLGCPNKPETIQNLPDENHWILLNLQTVGVYRINYDLTNWNLLIEELETSPNSIPVLNRVQLLNDAFALSWSSTLNYKIAFNLIKYLKSEMDYLPWKASVDIIDNINLLLKNTLFYEHFTKYMKEIIQPIYQKLGGMKLNEEYIELQVVIINLACKFQINDCVSSAMNILGMYRDNPVNNSIIHKDIRETIYCTGVIYGSEVDWYFLWDKYKATDIPSEKNSILQALGCIKQKWLLQQYLNMSFEQNSDIRPQDVLTVFTAVASNPIGYNIAKKFLFTRIKDIYDYMGQANDIAKMLLTLAEYMTSPDEYKELTNFIEENSDEFKDIGHIVDQSLEKARLNVGWGKAHLKEFTKIFRY